MNLSEPSRLTTPGDAKRLSRRGWRECTCLRKEYHQNKHNYIELEAMEISLHRSERQMRDNYCGKGGSDDSRAATTRLMSDYASGIKYNNMIFCYYLILKPLPPTSIEQFNRILEHNRRTSVETTRQNTRITRELAETRKQLSQMQNQMAFMIQRFNYCL